MKKNYGWKMMAAMMVLAGTMVIGSGDAYAQTVHEGSCGERINWTLDENGVMTISGSGLMNEGCGEDEAVTAEVWQDVKRIVVESGVKDIANYAFYGCRNLESVVLPAGITRIGCSAFQDCESLTSVSMEDGIGYIGSSAFENCYQLTSIDLPSGLETITYSMFRNCGLKSIVIPEGVVSIDECAFRSCFNLESVYLPASTTNVAETAFRLCENLTNIVYGIGKGEETATVEPAPIETEAAVEPAPIETEAVVEPAPIELEAPVITKIVNTAKGIQITWNAVENAQEYRVYRRVANETGYKRVKITSGTSFLNSDVKSGVTYYYKVRAAVTAENGVKTLSPSGKVKTICRVNRPTLESVASGSTKRSIVVRWKKVAGAASYKIRISTNKNFTTYREIAVSGSAGSKKITGLVKGKRYYVKVYGVGKTSAGKTFCSAASNCKSAVAK